MSADDTTDNATGSMFLTMLRGLGVAGKIIKVLTEHEDEISGSVHDQTLPLVEEFNAHTKAMMESSAAEIFRRELDAGWPPEGGGTK